MASLYFHKNPFIKYWYWDSLSRASRVQAFRINTHNIHQNLCRVKINISSSIGINASASFECAAVDSKNEVDCKNIEITSTTSWVSCLVMLSSVVWFWWCVWWTSTQKRRDLVKFYLVPWWALATMGRLWMFALKNAGCGRNAAIFKQYCPRTP